MKNARYAKWLVISLVLVLLLFLPVFSVNVVPEWSLRLIDNQGRPVSNLRIDQMWKDYSLEFWRFEHSDETMSTDEEGIVRFPARDIRVSVVQVIATKCVDAVSSINPHASYGPSSYAICRGSSSSCTPPSYIPGEELPKVVVVTK